MLLTSASRTRIALLAALALALTCLGGSTARAQQSWKDWLPSLPKTPGGVQRESVRRMMPAALRLGPSGAPPAVTRSLRVRVWAAADFRRQTVDGPARFRRILERVNAATRDWPGVRFEVVETRSWDCESGSRDMSALVDELERADTGDDVDLVVGLVAALPAFPGAIENIGMARLFGRHLVMRSLHDLAEYDLLHKEFDTLTDSERDTLLAARKVHKEQVIFLHEWAHTLGVIHAQRASAIMNPAYDASMAGFDAVEAQLLDAALRHRASDGAGWRAPTATEFRSIIAATPDADWDPRDRQQLLALVAPTVVTSLAKRSTAASPPRELAPPSPSLSSSPPPLPVEGPLGDADRAVLRDALRLAQASRYDDAWKRLAALEAHHPRSAEVRLAVCELAWRHPSGAARAALAEVACRGAIELAPADPRPHLYLADIYLSGGDAARARAPLEAAAEALAAASVADAASWRLLALVLQRANLPTLAERAAAHGGAEVEVAVQKWARALRRRMALPIDAEALGLPPPSEADYIRAVEAARAAFGAPTEAASIESAAREFHGLPAAERLRCEAALHRGLVADVRAACSPLLPLPPRASLAQLRASYATRFER